MCSARELTPILLHWFVLLAPGVLHAAGADGETRPGSRPLPEDGNAIRRADSAAAVRVCGPRDDRIWRTRGTEVEGLHAFDDAMRSYMQEREIARGALAVSYRGRLVLARGYTWLPEGEEATSPRSLFRIASVSKPLTAVGILRLVEERRLDLDQPVAPLLGLDGVTDPRWEDVTVRRLLIHRGGWDRAASFDPMFQDDRVSKAQGLPLPTTPWSIIGFMEGVRLDFEPGTRQAYSNFGYCLLGRVIERVTGRSYDDYIRAAVLRPLGVSGMRLARTLREDAAPGEVDYDDPRGGTVPNVMGRGPARVPRPYGGFNVEAMDAHGGWIASAVDLARFAASFDVPDEHPVLSRAMIDRMWSRPREVSGSEETYAAMGWSVRDGRDGRDGRDAWHAGSLPGTWSLLVRRRDGINWAAAFNRRSEGSMPDSAAIDPALHRAADAVEAWPAHDLFAVD